MASTLTTSPKPKSIISAIARSAARWLTCAILAKCWRTSMTPKLKYSRGRTVHVGGAQIAIHRGLDMAGGLGFFTARHAGVSHHHPSLVPTVVVAGNHPACSEEAFRNRTTAFLGLS
jgi:hypothetical protein